MKVILRTVLVLLVSSLLIACSPHPGTGVWQAHESNDMGIQRLVVGFDGRAEFQSTRPDSAIWHCFWARLDAESLRLDCTPSTNPVKKKTFVLSTADRDSAKLLDDDNQKKQLIATLSRVDENPQLPE